MATTHAVEAPQLRRWRRIRGPVLVAGGVLAASVVLHFRDPHDSGSWGYCPWLLLTGTYCPGCGGLRAVNDLTRGDISAAASSNLLFVGSIPLIALLWTRWLTARWQNARQTVSSRRALLAAGAFLLLALAFTVVRNTPSGAWLTP